MLAQLVVTVVAQAIRGKTRVVTKALNNATVHLKEIPVLGALPILVTVFVPIVLGQQTGLPMALTHAQEGVDQRRAVKKLLFLVGYIAPPQIPHVPMAMIIMALLAAATAYVRVDQSTA